MKKCLISITLLLIASFLLPQCSSNKKEGEEPIVKKKRREINMDKRLERDKTNLFGNLSGNKGTTFEFSTSNVLWRASLESLDFLPLNTIDYSGGLIISDWYSSDLSNESIKIEVRFLSNELKASSVKVKSFKKTCNTNQCKTIKMKDSFNQKIKNNIIAKARDIKIQDENKKK